MKRKILLAFSIFLLLIIMAVSASAEDVPTATVDNVSGSAGETITVNVYAKNFNAVKSGAFDIKGMFDENVLEFVNAEIVAPEATLSGFYNSTLKGAFAHSSNTDMADGVVFIITFKIKDDAPVGTTTVKCTVQLKTKNSAGKEVAMTVNNIAGSVTVKCKNHDFSAKSDTYVAKEATCTKPKQYYYTCSACGEKGTQTYDVVGSQLSHDYKDTVTNPTCTKQGYTTHTCKDCGNTLVDTYVNAKGHNKVTIPGKAATCTSTGLTDGVKCSTCNTILTAQTVIPKKDHTESDWIVDVAAKCTVDGSKHKECTVCHTTLKTEAITKTGHNEVTIPGKAATCTSTGLTDGVKCSTCNTIITAQAVTPITSHTYDDEHDDTCNVCGFVRGIECEHTNTEIIPGVPATCTETGLTEGRYCTACGAITVEQEVIPAGHNYDTKWSHDTDGHWHECSCGEVSDYFEHSWDEGRIESDKKILTCTVCGEQITEAIKDIVDNSSNNDDNNNTGFTVVIVILVAVIILAGLAFLLIKMLTGI